MGRTMAFYRKNSKAYRKKLAYDKKYHGTPERRKYRSDLNKKNRKAGTYGNGDGKDYDHSQKRMRKASSNRAADRPRKKGLKKFTKRKFNFRGTKGKRKR